MPQAHGLDGYFAYIFGGFAVGGELSAAGAAVVVADVPALLVELNARLVQFDAARRGL
ncbi:MAG: hypothetical protein M3021_01800 [Actinomycetota bacterium]|nr:hypothetical protein [Actinomycetota bacterium]